MKESKKLGRMTKFARNIIEHKERDNNLILEEKVHGMRRINFWVGQRY